MGRLSWLYFMLGILGILLSTPGWDNIIDIIKNASYFGSDYFYYYFDFSIILTSLLIILGVIYILIAFFLKEKDRFKGYLKISLITSTSIFGYLMWYFLIEPWSAYLLSTGNKYRFEGFGAWTLLIGVFAGLVLLLLILMNVFVFKKINNNESE